MPSRVTYTKPREDNRCHIQTFEFDDNALRPSSSCQCPYKAVPLLVVRIGALVLSAYTAFLCIQQQKQTDIFIQDTQLASDFNATGTTIHNFTAIYHANENTSETLIRMSWWFSLSHFTLWWNVLAFASLAIAVVRDTLKTIHPRRETYMSTIADVALAIQHPYAWVVFVGYWFAAASKITYDNVHVADALFTLPGVYVCGPHGNIRTPLCNSAILLDLLLHLAMPLVMMRMPGNKTRKHAATYTGILVIYILYMGTFICFSLALGFSPYREISIFSPTFPRDATIMTIILFVRVYMDTMRFCPA